MNKTNTVDFTRDPVRQGHGTLNMTLPIYGSSAGT